jgi:hypothetical protein
MLDRKPRRSGMLAGHFEYAARAGVTGPKCVRVAKDSKMVRVSGIDLILLHDLPLSCVVSR